MKVVPISKSTPTGLYGIIKKYKDRNGEVLGMKFCKNKYLDKNAPMVTLIQINL